MRLIDADALYIEIMDRGIDGLQLDDLSEIQQVIADAPTVDAVQSGKWKRVQWHEDEDGGFWIVRCSACGIPHNKESRFCPNCGAKME